MATVVATKIDAPHTYNIAIRTDWANGTQTQDMTRYWGTEMREVFSANELAKLLAGKVVTRKGVGKQINHYVYADLLAQNAFAKAVR